MQQSPDLQLVLRAVDGGSGNMEARSQLARVLRLEDRIVSSIIDRAPIVLLRDIPAEEARLAESGLRQLGGAGIAVEITPDATGLPKVNWPTQPKMSDLFPMARSVAPEVQALLDRVAHLEARVAELEAAVGLAATPSARPAPAAPAPRALPPMPAGPLDAVPALAGELFWPTARVLHAIPFAETGDNGRAAPPRGAARAAIEQEVAPLAPSHGGDLVELEPLDLPDEIGPGVELEPLEPLGADDAPIELEPVGGRAAAGRAKPAADEDDLPAWTGRARDYKGEAGGKGGAAAKPAPKAAPAPKSKDDDALPTWSGRARDYVSDRHKPVKDAPAVDAADDIAELPELDLSADDEPVVAPTIPPQRQLPRDEELPELEPVLGESGVKRKPEAKKGERKTGAIPRPPTGAGKKPAPAPAKKVAAAEASGDFSVFLSKIAGNAKKQAAIELLCEIKGIDEDDAAALCEKMIIPVVQGVSKEKAEDILGQFAAHKIQGRITRKKK